LEFLEMFANNPIELGLGSSIVVADEVLGPGVLGENVFAFSVTSLP
jgi:hypothetical protein